METLINWLFSQESIVVIILGTLLYFVARMYLNEKKAGVELRNQYEQEKTALVDKLIELTSEVTEVTSTVVEKIDSQITTNSEAHKQMLDILHKMESTTAEIKTLMTNGHSN